MEPSVADFYIDEGLFPNRPPPDGYPVGGFCPNKEDGAWSPVEG